MNRREFLGRAATTIALAGVAPGLLQTEAVAKEVSPVFKTKLKKAVVYSMLPGDQSMEARFKLAADCGFDGVEAPPITDLKECEAMRKAAAKAGVDIHSVIYGGWGKPLSAADPKDRAEGEQAAIDGLKGAKAMGADTLLLVPGRVTEETRYKDVYERSQASIKKIIPTAEKLGVVIAVENVWNGFLLSPMEFARYVDEFKSPWVRAYFDVGNVIGAFGISQDWIRTLGTSDQAAPREGLQARRPPVDESPGWQRQLERGPQGDRGSRLQRLHDRRTRWRRCGISEGCCSPHGQDHRRGVADVGGSRAVA